MSLVSSSFIGMLIPTRYRLLRSVYEVVSSDTDAPWHLPKIQPFSKVAQATHKSLTFLKLLYHLLLVAPVSASIEVVVYTAFSLFCAQMISVNSWRPGAIFHVSLWSSQHLGQYCTHGVHLAPVSNTILHGVYSSHLG